MKVKYNKAHIGSAIEAVHKIGEYPRFIYATAYGFVIDKAKPPFNNQPYCEVIDQTTVKHCQPKWS